MKWLVLVVLAGCADGFKAGDVGGDSLAGADVAADSSALSETVEDVVVTEVATEVEVGPELDVGPDGDVAPDVPDGPEVVIPHEQTCTDLKDDDDDGLTDCDDGDCRVVDRGFPVDYCASGDGELGVPCGAHFQCAGIHPHCWDEAQSGYPSGMCSRWCTPGSEECGDGGACVGTLPGRGTCAPTCDESRPCRGGYTCTPIDGAEVCLPGCTSPGQCSIGNTCTSAGLCITTELCDAPGDEDSDGKVNCEDEDCAYLAACDPGPACNTIVPALAAGEPALSESPSVINGDTTSSGALLAGSCTGGYHGHELLYSVMIGAAGTTGTFEATVTGAGNFGVYVRRSCVDPASEVGCSDKAFEGQTETLSIAMRGGDSYAVIVDSRGADDAGPFVLTLRWLVDECGDHAVTGMEGCDDGGHVDDDGCSAACQPELAYWCAAPATLGTTLTGGDTSDAASRYFEGTCTNGHAPEDIYRFTATADGYANIYLANPGDRALALYARSDCADVTSELDCRSADANGLPLRFPVSAGLSYYVFVDGTLTPDDVGPYTLLLEYD